MASLMVFILLIYVYSHIFFACNLSHVTPMYGAFLSATIACGTPAMLAALSLCFFSNMMGGITHYGMSHAPIFLESCYVNVRA